MADYTDLTVAEAARLIEAQGLLKRKRHDHSERIIERVRELLGMPLPKDLKDLYREQIAWIGDFASVAPVWNDWVGWRPASVKFNRLQQAGAVPIFSDGCGSLYGLDLTAGASRPAVYFFDHERDPTKPTWAAGSTLPRFMLMLAEADRARDAGWPDGWRTKIDPDLYNCPRAPPEWLAG